MPSGPDIGRKLIALLDEPMTGPVGTVEPTDVLHLQATAGNEAVARLVQRQKAPTPPKAAPGAKAKEQGSGTSTDTGTKEPANEPVYVDFGWFDAKTYKMLADGLRGLAHQLEGDIADLPDSSVWGDADAWIMEVRPWIPWLETFGQKPIEGYVAKLAEGRLVEYRQIQAAVREEKTWPLRKAYYQAEIASEKAAAEAEKTEGQMADAFRASYRSGSTDRIKDVLTVIKTFVSLGRNLRRLASDFATEVLKLEKPRTSTKVRIPTGDPMGRAPMNRPLGAIKLETTNVNKYVEKMDMLARGMAAANLALTLRGRRTRKATESEQGVKDLTDAVSAFSDIGTILAVLPPHVSLIVTGYISPALKAIGALMGRVVEGLHDINKGAVEQTGDVMYPGAEPGGQKMLDFMIAMKRSASEADAPVVGGSVEEYILDHREMLGAGAEDKVPTDGWGPWRDLDRAGARRWAYRNRDRLWQLLYGSMSVPRR